MLPTLQQVLDDCFELGARYKREPASYDEVGILRALDEARTLVGLEATSESLALFWSFSHRPKCAGHLFPFLPGALAIANITATGETFITPNSEVWAFTLSVVVRKLTFDDVQKRWTRWRANIDSP